MLYDDGLIAISEEELIVRQFYFPLGRERKVRLRDIRRVELKPLTLWDGSFRLWGMGVRPIWFHFDSARLTKKHFIQVDTGKWLKLGLTPKNMDGAFELLRAQIGPKPPRRALPKLA